MNRVSIFAMMCIEVWQLFAMGAFFPLMAASKTESWSDRIVASLLSQKHDFYPANSEHFQYNGRWMPTPDENWYSTSFVGGSVSFTVNNCSSVLLSLANMNLKHDANIWRDESIRLEMEHLPEDASSAGKATVQIIRNGWPQAPLEEVFGNVRIYHELQPNRTYTFQISKAGSSKDITPVQFKGIWVSQGGRLILPYHENGKLGYDKEKISTDTAYWGSFTRTNKEIVEIMAPASLFDFPHNNTLFVRARSDTTSAQTWLNLLSKNSLYTSISPIPYGSTICITKTCTGKQPSIKTPTLADTYFRAGPLNSDLFKYPWFSTLESVNPAALVLEIGTSDFVQFLATFEPPNKHSLDAFIADFTRAYLDFIKIIRRTLHDSRANADIRLGDQAYQYISAPSSFPIFLLTPIVPQTRRQVQIGMLVHKAFSEVAFHLRENGDANIYVIDTASWFTKDDFVVAQHKPETIHESDTYVLRETGHITLAYHLSSMLCPYVNANDCPFERYSDYVGKLYLPEEDDMERKLQDIKIAKLKEMFSVL